jgi:SWI/SNF-related matrix-associated actin-dependent regulator 1 of chromatin subfamily A
MKLTYRDGRFIFECQFGEKHIPKEAKFLWDPQAKKWWTKFEDRAAVLIEYADNAAQQHLEGLQQTVALSRAVDYTGEFPVPAGESLRGYQKACVAFMLPREAVLVGDEMGLGKTPQTIVVINADESINRVLIICPATIKRNWQAELEKWLTRPFDIGIAAGKVWPKLRSGERQIVIINYDILGNFRRELRQFTWDMRVCDESQMLQNPKTKRVANVLGKWNPKDKGWDISPIPARRRVFLSGTPFRNRPKELWPIMRACDPDRWRSYRYAAERYFGRHWNGWGWDDNGATNMEEFQQILRSTFMIRRLKKDVLTELPPKIRQIIELPPNGAQHIIDEENRQYEEKRAAREAIEEMERRAKEAEASADPTVYNEAVAKLQAAQKVLFNEMSRVRHETAKAKLPLCIEFIREAMAEGNKIVVFGWHTDLIQAIVKAFPEYKAQAITGETPVPKRFDIVKQFQEDPEFMLLAGNIQAAGTGITLTASSHVIFCELDWVPGNITQAEDRTHRFGQENSVLVQHLVFEGSLDAKMARTLVAKQDVIHAGLDSQSQVVPGSKMEEVRPVTPKDPATLRAGRELSDMEILVIHRALQMLAGVCDGAKRKDEMGFNAFDSKFGKDLAYKSSLTQQQAQVGRDLVFKYRRQLPHEVMDLLQAE